ncbi:MAG: pyridoxal phosphate-dependent decarboxylase family protein [Candidatus Sericytochromatia bacterium]
MNDLEHLAPRMADMANWEAQWPPFEPAFQTLVGDTAIDAALGELTARLADNYPFFHPHYAGQMLKPPHRVAAMAYYLAMRFINPNNHALDGGPATAAMEREAVAQIARMVGFDSPLGHLTSGGTVANLEALWVARSLHPDRAIAHSAQAHYTHARMGQVLGVKTVSIAVDDRGRLSIPALLEALDREAIGTVVATAGTTGLGAVDPIDELVALGAERGFRVHVDAAYGGYYRLLASHDPPLVATGPFKAIAQADSLVIDPHKHGLQPYGCGCVLFRDPSVGRFYQHDSPYTYFTSDELHLGEISLECSRAGAAAAALWTTMRCFPLAAETGMGPILAACRAAAIDWATRIEQSEVLHLVMPPELDILAYFATGAGWRATDISQETDRLFRALMEDPKDPLYLAKLVLPRALVEKRAPDIEWDAETVTVLRSSLLKPEHERAVPAMHAKLEAAARQRA